MHLQHKNNLNNDPQNGATTSILISILTIKTH